MVLFDGFWTGLFVGFLLAFAVISITGLCIESRKQKQRQFTLDILKSLDESAKEKINEINN